MKKTLIIVLAFLLTLSFAVEGVAQLPSIQLLVKKKSGLFGLGSPRSIEITLTSETKQGVLNSDNVNKGKYFYFLCRTVGDWAFDEDFVKEDLLKLSISQGTQQYRVLSSDGLSAEGSAKILTLGFSKTLQIHQPFTFKFDLGGEMDQKEYNVPEEYWPGYSQLTTLLSQAEGLTSGRQYREAVRVCNIMLANPVFKIFPKYGDIPKQRTQIFERYFDETASTLTISLLRSTVPTMEKMNQIDSAALVYRYLVDSLPNPALNINISDSSVNTLVNGISRAAVKSRYTRDSLQLVYDEESTRWIVEGNLAGDKSSLYQHIIPVLVYAYTSWDFNDTSSAPLKLSVPEDLQVDLTKYKLNDAFDSFARVCNRRYQNRASVLSSEFLSNLQRDTVAFSLPYYSMLKAVTDFLGKDYRSAKNEITYILRTCDNNELLTRFHVMRNIIEMRTTNVPQVVINLLSEARLAEARNDQEGALDRYKQVLTIAPNFAYGCFALGQYYMNAGDPTRAVTFFKKAYQIDKLFVSAYRECYKQFTRSANFKSMIEVLTQALQNGNDYWETNFNLGFAYMSDGDPVKAIKSYERALVLSPKSYQTFIQLGLAHQNTKAYLKAREYFQKAVEINPERQEAVDFLKNLEDLEKGVH